MGEKWAHKADRETERNNLRDVSLKVVDEELNKLADYYTAFAHSKKSTTEWNELIKAKAEELDSVNRTILKLGGDAKAWREQIDQCDEVLILHEDKRLAEYVPDLNQPVTPKDIVQAKADEYKLSLMDLDHYELLKLVVDEFKAKPERSPSPAAGHR